MSPQPLLYGKKGDWTQVFMMLLFALIVVVAIVLLTMEAGRLVVVRPELDTDLRNMYANAYLISMLRTEPAGVSIADRVIMDQDGKHDDELRSMIAATTPSTAYLELTITYPDRRQIVLSNIVLGSMTGYVIRDRYAGTSKTVLPGTNGNIDVALVLFDAPRLKDAQDVDFKLGDNKAFTVKTITSAVPVSATAPSGR